MDADKLKIMADEVRGSFQTVETMTLEFIREAILRGIFRPGERLQQDGIAESLGVSRMPVRASLRRLEDEGLVVFSPHRGAAVRLLSDDEIAEIYELRILLEQRLLDAVAPKIDDMVLADLERIAREVRGDRHSANWIDRRRSFYARLYEPANMPRTVSLVMQLRREVGPYLVLRDPGHSHEHLVVLRELSHGDVAEAKRCLTEHLRAVSLELQAIVRQEIGGQ